MPSLTRDQVAAKLAVHYSAKLNGDVWAGFDDTKRAYYIRGENLPSAPELRDRYPNGWSLLDYIKPTRARQIIAEK